MSVGSTGQILCTPTEISRPSNGEPRSRGKKKALLPTCFVYILEKLAGTELVANYYGEYA